MIRRAFLLPLTLLAACSSGPARTPPPSRSFDGLPISGTLTDAHAAGFTACIADNVSIRCRKAGVMVEGQGPYSAAIDLIGSDGSGGFDHLTVWHDTDQGAVLSVLDTLKAKGWRSCLKGSELELVTSPKSPVRFAADISYWGKRRLMLIPEANRDKPRC